MEKWNFYKKKSFGKFGSQNFSVTIFRTPQTQGQVSAHGVYYPSERPIFVGVFASSVCKVLHVIPLFSSWYCSTWLDHYYLQTRNHIALNYFLKRQACHRCPVTENPS